MRSTSFRITHFCAIRRFSTSTTIAKQKVESGHWTNKNVQREYLKKIEPELGISKWSDWYNVTFKDVSALGAAGIIYHYGGSLAKCLQELFPENPWKPWNFHTIERNWWQDKANHKAFLEDYATAHNFKSYEDWYTVASRDIIEYGGSVLLQKYQDSLVSVLKSNFPEYKWEFFKMRFVPNGFWKNKENQLAFLEHLKKELSIKSMEDWYRVTAELIISKGGTGFLALYKNSTIMMLKTIFPDYKWITYKFNCVPKHYWDDKKMQREYFDDVAKQLNIQNWTDWYKFRVEDLAKFGGQGLLNVYYGDSISKALSTVYPEHPWIPWEFKKIPDGYWNDPKNVQFAMKKLAEKLNIKSKNDWRAVSYKQIASQRGYKTLLDKFRGLQSLLKAAFPDEQWDDLYEVASPSRKLTQNLLYRYLQELFPSIFDIYIDYPHPTMLFKNSNVKMELDIYIPSLSLAFEYQGAQHYGEEIGELSPIQQRDEEKRQACKENGITLIEIPHWWDMTLGSLKATIKQHLPNLIVDEVHHSPIPSTMPSKSKETKTNVQFSSSPFSFRNSLQASPVQWDEKSWFQLLDSNDFQYFVKQEVGNRSPKCSSCGKVIKDKQELRVVTLGTNVFSNVKQVSRIHFCFNSQCLDKINSTEMKGMKIPTYNGRLGVPYQIVPLIANYPQEAFSNVEFVVQYE